ncbi:MAG: PDZ domain-containing protein, partial [Eubacteriales bacterium]|nr:PDZ domain-containing protein [Eubacteriales bacterium]
SPAEKSGLKVGDIIVEVDESVVKAYTEMKTILGTKNAGDSVALKVFRADETLSNDRVISGDVAGQYLDFTVGLEILDASNT